MPIYDFRCRSTGHITEHLRPMRVELVWCVECSDISERVAANRVAVTLPEVDVRGKFRRFTEASAEIDHAASTVEQSTGQAVQTPNYWKLAQARAGAMAARGEIPQSARKEQLG